MDEILEQQSGDYYMDIREFKNQAIEVLLRPIRPMHEGATKAAADPLSYSSACHAMGESSSTYTGPKIHHEREEKSEFELAENFRRACRRAKQNIRWLCKQVEADRLLTLTYRRNEQDREVVKTDFKKFLRLVRKQEKDWKYVAVLEKQDRGAFHVHVAIKGWQRVSFLRRCWYQALGGRGDETGEGTPGQVDVTSPRKARWGTQLTHWKTSKLAQYLTKYLSKTFDETSSEKKRYWHSADAHKPQRSRFVLCSIDLVCAICEALNIIYFKYGFHVDFSRSWMAPNKGALWLSLGEP